MKTLRTIALTAALLSVPTAAWSHAGHPEPPPTVPPVTAPPVVEPPVTTPPVTEPPVTEPPITVVIVDWVCHKADGSIRFCSEEESDAERLHPSTTTTTRAPRPNPPARRGPLSRTG